MTAPLDLAAARALCEAASPGPWRAEWARMRHGGVWRIEYTATDEMNEGASFIVANVDGHPANHDDDSNNAAFIATARTLLPQLLAAVEQLQRERDEARAERDAYRYAALRLLRSSVSNVYCPGCDKACATVSIERAGWGVNGYGEWICRDCSKDLAVAVKP